MSDNKLAGLIRRINLQHIDLLTSSGLAVAVGEIERTIWRHVQDVCGGHQDRNDSVRGRSAAAASAIQMMRGQKMAAASDGRRLGSRNRLA